jgi:hypothetical protein
VDLSAADDHKLRAFLRPRTTPGSCCSTPVSTVSAAGSSAHSLQLAVTAESYKLVCVDDIAARERGELL